MHSGEAGQRGTAQCKEVIFVMLKLIEKNKLKVLHLGRNYLLQLSTLGTECPGSSSGERVLGALEAGQEPAARPGRETASSIQGCNSRSTSRSSGQGMSPLCLALIRLYMGTMARFMPPSAERH